MTCTTESSICRYALRAPSADHGTHNRGRQRLEPTTAQRVAGQGARRHSGASPAWPASIAERSPDNSPAAPHRDRGRSVAEAGADEPYSATRSRRARAAEAASPHTVNDRWMPGIAAAALRVVPLYDLGAGGCLRSGRLQVELDALGDAHRMGLVCDHALCGLAGLMGSPARGHLASSHR